MLRTCMSPQALARGIPAVRGCRPILDANIYTSARGVGRRPRHGAPVAEDPDGTPLPSAG
jgi:hypothetical protein